MSLVEIFVRNPVKVAVGVLLVALFGFVALQRMPMQLTPEVQTPIITVTTLWPGASPQEVEQEIIIEQEEWLKSVEGAVKLSSESADSMGTITIEFQVGTDLEDARVRVDNRLQQVPEYPEDADQPVIATGTASDNAMAWFILSARHPSDEEFDNFAKRYPALADKLPPVRNAAKHNAGLAALRLRDLAKQHAEFRELLPPEDLEVNKLRRFAEDEIESRFERVPGVSQSQVFGGWEDELQVVVDPEKLAARRITLTQVRNVLRGQNEDTSAGDFWEGKRRWVVRALGQFRSPEQVENQLLAVRDGAPVFVRDVAEVRLGYKKPAAVVRRFGESCIAVNAARASGVNELEVMAGLREAVVELNEQILGPRGLELTQVYDETDYIYSAIDLVKNNIFVGGALTMIVLMLFLHPETRTFLMMPFIVATAVAASFISPWFFVICLGLIIGAGFWFARAALVVGLAIPISIIGTFVMLNVLGSTLNVISLAGLAFAVGMFIDNAIVVLENIYRRHSLGESPTTAAVRGTQEVFGAVVASSLTNMAVFLPVIFVQEEAGQLFRDIALAITGALFLSILVAMTVIPTATSRLFRRHTKLDPPDVESKPRMRVVNPANDNGTNGDGAHQSHAALVTQPTSHWKHRVADLAVAPLNAFGTGFSNFVVGINRWALASTGRRLAIVLTMLGISVGLSWLFWPKVEYLPAGNRNLVIGFVLPPPGYNLDELMRLGRTVEERLRPYWDIEPESPEAQELDFPVIGDFFFVAAGRMVFMGLSAYDADRASELVPLVQHAVSGLPGTIAMAQQTSLFEEGLQGGRKVDVEITGPDLAHLVGLGGQVMGQVMAIMPTAQPFPKPSLDLSSPEIHVEPKLVQAADMQVSSTDLGFAVNALVDGAYVSDYYLGGKKIDLTVMGNEQFASTTQDIEALPIATPLGQLVPLNALATVELGSGPEQINHRERMRAITIQVTPAAEMPLEYAMTQIQSKIVQPLRESGQLNGGYQINLSGTADKLRDTWRALRFNILLACVITYLLMAALFESWLYPFVIILSVPLGAVGGILGLWLLNFYVLQTLDVLTMLGFVILIGTVVNNPILIIHQALNHIREDGMSHVEAVLESTRTRLRPIFATTVTTVLGLLPLVLFPGAGSELYRGLGAVLLGGLVVSTVFTLLLIPALFSLTMDARDWFMRLVFGRGPSDEVSERAEPRPVSHHEAVLSS
jgi:hydrophobic/amphiphilic exporter-1 (mainly G- bacteria), HAE1 family